MNTEAQNDSAKEAAIRKFVQTHSADLVTFVQKVQHMDGEPGLTPAIWWELVNSLALSYTLAVTSLIEGSYNQIKLGAPELAGKASHEYAKILVNMVTRVAPAELPDHVVESFRSIMMDQALDKLLGKLYDKLVEEEEAVPEVKH